MVVKPECETVPDESRLIVDRVCSEADDDETEFEVTEVKAGYKRFDVADMNPNLVVLGIRF